MSPRFRVIAEWPNVTADDEADAITQAIESFDWQHPLPVWTIEPLPDKETNDGA